MFSSSRKQSVVGIMRMKIDFPMTRSQECASVRPGELFVVMSINEEQSKSGEASSGPFRVTDNRLHDDRLKCRNDGQAIGR